MIQLVVLGFLLASASGFAGKLPKASTDVLGQPVSIQDYPYAVSVRFYTNHNCGGILISEKFALSAAACSHGLEDYLQLFIVNLGTSEAEEPGTQYVELANIYTHPLFSGDLNYNIAILEFATPIVFGPGVQPATLAQEGEIIEEDSEGFGLGFSCGDILRIVNLKMISNEKCHDSYDEDDFEINETTACGVLTEEEDGFCGRDQGGPLVIGNKVVGILGSNYMLHGKPLVFTKISTVRSFIKEVTGL